MLGYNFGMRRLTKETAIKEEISVINDWLDYYECQKIRAYLLDRLWRSKNAKFT